jgi:hypothetical protein
MSTAVEDPEVHTLRGCSTHLHSLLLAIRPYPGRWCRAGRSSRLLARWGGCAPCTALDAGIRDDRLSDDGGGIRTRWAPVSPVCAVCHRGLGLRLGPRVSKRDRLTTVRLADWPIGRRESGVGSGESEVGSRESGVVPPPTLVSSGTAAADPVKPRFKMKAHRERDEGDDNLWAPDGSAFKRFRLAAGSASCFGRMQESLECGLDLAWAFRRGLL